MNKASFNIAVATPGLAAIGKIALRGRQLEYLATPAGIEPATNSLEVVRTLNVFNAHSDKTALPAALLIKPEV